MKLKQESHTKIVLNFQEISTKIDVIANSKLKDVVKIYPNLHRFTICNIY